MEPEKAIDLGFSIKLGYNAEKNTAYLGKDGTIMAERPFLEAFVENSLGNPIFNMLNIKSENKFLDLLNLYGKEILENNSQQDLIVYALDGIIYINRKRLDEADIKAHFEIGKDVELHYNVEKKAIDEAISNIVHLNVEGLTASAEYSHDSVCTHTQYKGKCIDAFVKIEGKYKLTDAKSDTYLKCLLTTLIVASFAELL